MLKRKNNKKGKKIGNSEAKVKCYHFIHQFESSSFPGNPLSSLT